MITKTTRQMRRHIAALLVLPLIAGTAAAQVQIYGTIDVGVGQLANQNAGPPTTGVTRVKGVFSGNLQTSYIGFRGTEDLGGGLLARFQLESFIRVDTGQPGRFDANPGTGADPYWARSSWVGLTGGFGDLRLGATANPLWIAMLQTNALGSNSVFSPSFRQLYNGGTRGRSDIDTTMVNSVSYQTPALSGPLDGLSALATLQAGEGRGSGFNHALHLGYRAGPVNLSLAVQRARHQPVPDVATAADQDMLLLGGAYNFGLARVFAQYTTVKNVGNKSRLPHVGATVPLFGVGTLQFSTGQDHNKITATGVSSTRRTTSLGYVHALSKRTELYGFLMTERFPVVGPAEDSGQSYMLGMRHTF